MDETTMTEEQQTQAYHMAHEAWHHVMRAVKLLGDLEQIDSEQGFNVERSYAELIRDSLNDYLALYQVDEDEVEDDEAQASIALTL